MKVQLRESRLAQKSIRKLPSAVRLKYEVWARLIEEHGTQILGQFPGYREERLSGVWAGCRSSRLNRKWRVIYRKDNRGELEVVTVEKVTAHDYRRK